LTMSRADPASATLALGKRLLQGLVYRLDLLELELREEQFRFLRRLSATALGLFLLFLGFVMLNLALVVSLWDAYGSGLLWLLAIIYLLLGAVCSAYVWYKLEHDNGPFNATLGELRKDLSAFHQEQP